MFYINTELIAESAKDFFEIGNPMEVAGFHYTEIHEKPHATSDNIGEIAANYVGPYLLKACEMAGVSAFTGAKYSKHVTEAKNYMERRIVGQLIKLDKDTGLEWESVRVGARKFVFNKDEITIY